MSLKFVTLFFFSFDNLDTKYHNGELEDDTEYAAFQRSFAESGYSEFGPLRRFSTKNDPTAAIVVPIVLLVVAMGVAGGIYIYRRRLNQDNGDADEEMPMNRPRRRGTASKFLGVSGIGKLNLRHKSQP